MTVEIFEFGDEEFEVLAEWLTRRGKGIFDISTLEGFLTALVALMGHVPHPSAARDRRFICRRRWAVPVLLFACLGLWGPAHAVTCSVETFESLPYTVCRVDLRTDRLQLFLANTKGEIYNGLDALRQDLKSQGKTLVVAMNAGMYRPDYSLMAIVALRASHPRAVTHPPRTP